MTARVEPYGDNQRLLAVRDAYDVREQLKRIPGARWVARERAWLMPNSPLTVKALLQILPSGVPEPTAALAVKAELSQRLSPELNEPLPNYSLVGPAWLHQTRAARWLATRDAALLQYGMRTGKTRSTLDAVRHLGAPVTLVLAPLNACAVWEREAARHHPNHFRFLRLDKGSTARRLKLLQMEILRSRGRQLIVALNFEAAWREPMGAALLKAHPDILVIDEIHRLKSPSSHQSRYAAQLGRNSGRRWGLSGTPLSQALEDAYAVFRALDTGVFGTSYAAFMAKYCIMGGYGGHEVLGYQNVEEFRERYFSLTLAATRDVLDLPPAIHETVFVELPRQAQELHDAILEEAIGYLEGGSREVVVTNVLTRFLRMSQIASGHVRTTATLSEEEMLMEIDSPFVDTSRVEEVHTAKQSATIDILQDLDRSEPVVVFCRFKHDMVQVAAAARETGREYYEISGARRDLALWLAAADRGAVLGVQYQSGSESLDLARASYCIFYDDVFSLQQCDQATARIHSTESKNRVVYFHLVARDTIDTYIRRTLNKRRDVLGRLMDERTLNLAAEMSDDG